jgi:hypothetical protein
MKFAAIVLKRRGRGIEFDAAIIQGIIQMYFRKESDIIIGDEKVTDRYRYVFYIEHWSNIPIKGEVLIFIPNIELLEEWDADFIKTKANFVLAKTKFTFDILTRLFPEKKSNIFLTNFTSGCHYSPSINKDPNLVSHFAGTSYLKGTYEVLSFWIKAKGFLETNPNVKLLLAENIPSFSPEREKIDKLWKALKTEPFTTFEGKKLVGTRYQNIYKVGYIPMTEYWYFMNRSLYLLQPSLIEGFGHDINLGRCMNSIVITTAAPPMSELIPNLKQQIAVEKKVPIFKYITWLKNLYKQTAVTADFIKFEDFQKKVSVLLDNPDKGKMYRREFLTDSFVFIDFIQKLLSGKL